MRLGTRRYADDLGRQFAILQFLFKVPHSGSLPLSNSHHGSLQNLPDNRQRECCRPGPVRLRPIPRLCQHQTKLGHRAGEPAALSGVCRD